MIRSFQLNKEAELLRLCRCRNWSEAALRSQTHPREATPNEICLRREGSTVLSLAVRLGAPCHTVSSLLDANVHQIGITHRLRGSIVHDALKHGVSSEVFCFLLQRTIDYQESVLDLDSQLLPSPNPSKQPSPEFRQVSVQNNRTLGGPDLLGCQDDLGRTVLHYLVEHFKPNGTPLQYLPVVEQRKRPGDLHSMSTTLECIQLILKAYPSIVNVVDADGSTPLLLLLQLAPHERRSESSALELEIQRTVERMLLSSPSSVSVARRIPRPWRFHVSFPSRARRSISWAKRNADAVEGSLTPLYYALLNGRSLDTISLLINANRQIGVHGSELIVTPHHEVCLHIAMTTRASLPIVEAIFNDAPDGITVFDVYGLTCIDWMWIRHVLDLFADPQDFLSNRVISRRRLVASQFPEWHEAASNLKSICAGGRVRSSAADALPVVELFQRMKVILPGSASAIEKAREKSSSGTTATALTSRSWSLLHAVCFVPCSIALLRVALTMDPDAKCLLRQQDARRRYPLHYAAERCMPYSMCLPLGIILPKVEKVCDQTTPLEEILPLFPLACHATDEAGQLPLHIAIDAAKQYRRSFSHEAILEPAFEMPTLKLLLKAAPSTLAMRDGKTKLYPWQQAAVDEGADLTVIYSLLRREPTLVVS
jgi:hypothetical protein